MISKVSELESIWPSTTLMAAKEMLKFGYQLGQGQGRRTWECFSDWTPKQQRRIRSRLRPLRWRTFPSFQRKEKEVHWPRDVYSPHQGHFLGSGRGYQIRSGTRITQGEIGLAFLIYLCPKEFLVNAIISPKNDLISTIWRCVPGEIASHWTIEPCFVVALAE